MSDREEVAAAVLGLLGSAIFLWAAHIAADRDRYVWAALLAVLAIGCAFLAGRRGQ